MERNHAKIISALRAKAADKSVTEDERIALNAKADELAAKYNVTEIPLDHEQARPRIHHYYNSERAQSPHYPFDFGGGAGKTPFDDEWLKTMPATTFVFFSDGKVQFYDFNLDEDTKNNGNYEFPQEEGLE